MLRILLIYCDYGRLGNRLHTHANALAWCIENNYNLINLSFSEYADFFKNSPEQYSGNLHQHENFIFKILSRRLFRNFLRTLLLSDKWLERLGWIVNQIMQTNNEELLESDLSRQIKQNKINIIKCWDISSRNSINIHQQKVRDYLRPNKRFVVTAEKIIDELRSKYDCVVGVHARRGDYKTYLGGKHYHSWESYQNWVLEVKNVLENKGYNKIGFILCSNETPPQKILNNSFIHFTGSNHFMVDLHILTLCDYNIGPPSSFGTWISWYGNVLRLIIHKDTKIENLENFNISNSC